MDNIDLFYDKGKLELCTFINEPTNKFMKLSSFVYGIISFHDGKIRVPGRLTDQLMADDDNVDFSSLEGREVVPRFRRRYSVGKSELIPTISLAFTLADEYYPHQEYSILTPNKEYDIPGVVGYGVYTSRFRIKESGLERAVPFVDEDAVTAAVEAGKLALIHSGVDSRLVGKVYVGSESNPYAVKPIASKVAQVLKLGEEDGDIQGVDAVDTEFACKAATSMFKDAAALVSYPRSGIKYAMVIGADNAQAAPRAALEVNWIRLLGTAAPRLFLENMMLSLKLKDGTHVRLIRPIFGAETVNSFRCMADDSRVTRLISSMSAKLHVNLWNALI